MRQVWLIVIVSALALGCARFNSVGWVDLPDGSRLKAMTLQVDTAIGTDITYGLVYQCTPPGENAGLKGKLAKKLRGPKAVKCMKVGEFGGSSPAMLKSVFGNAAAGAAIGGGIALQDYEGNAVNVEGSKQQQGQFQKQDQRQYQQQRRKY